MNDEDEEYRTDNISFDIYQLAKPIGVFLRLIKADGTEIEVELSSNDAYRIGIKLISGSWQATKDELGNKGEVFRRLGYYN